jgi:hypothetical protein
VRLRLVGEATVIGETFDKPCGPVLKLFEIKDNGTLMSYENHQLHKLSEGTVLLYTRNGSPFFHARLKIHGISGYVKIASTKKRICSEAYAVAKSWYEVAKCGLRRPRRIGERWRPQDGSGRRSRRAQPL